jgi:hypothetical protein
MQSRVEHGSSLMGRVLSRTENQGDRGYFWERRSAIYLYAGSPLRFLWEVETSSSVAGGGLSAASGGRQAVEGRWTIAEQLGLMYLVLYHDDGEETRLLSQNGGPGRHFLDHQAWDRRAIG